MQNLETAEAYNNFGNALLAQNKIGEAISAFQNAIRLRRDFVEAFFNLGNAYHRAHELQLAVSAFDNAIGLRPNMAVAHLNLGNVYRSLDRIDDASLAYQQAIQIRSDYFEAFYNLGVLQQQQGDLIGAEHSFRRVLELRPDFTPAANNLGCIYNSTGDYRAAAQLLRSSLEKSPTSLDLLLNLGAAFVGLGDFDAALQVFRQAYPLDKKLAAPLVVLAKQHVCRWENIEELSQHVIDELDSSAGEFHPTLAPFIFVGLPVPTSPSQQLRCARRWSQGFQDLEVAFHRRYPGKSEFDFQRRLRVGYLSADFNVHAVAFMVAELFEEHDRSQFEIFGYSIGIDDQSDIRRRIVNAFDHFCDLSSCSFEDAARTIAKDQIDILIDLQGHTRNARTQILAYRPAPIQVNYLGYPGTMGASYMDYILVDNFVVPRDQQRFFSEQLMHLPGSYQVNDGKCRESATQPTRADCRLPEDCLVFCSFNNSFKVTPIIFDIWLRLLQSIPASVLWLSETNTTAVGECIRHAAQRGIPSERIVIAPHVALADHLARQPLADLSLDTFPYNGHATASIALRMGVPIVTLSGETMASRVAGSLLQALGIPELIARSYEEYESIALQLASDRMSLANVRDKLSANLRESTVFSGREFARKVEQAYKKMWLSYNDSNDQG
ncbi:MAG: tetratricopeptide repeat protein [Pirellulaceae bacterium]|nr:tetratricopeptide repeat protein [Pirellulaceae bacterium]